MPPLHSLTRSRLRYAATVTAAASANSPAMHLYCSTRSRADIQLALLVVFEGSCKSTSRTSASGQPPPAAYPPAIKFHPWSHLIHQSDPHSMRHVLERVPASPLATLQLRSRPWRRALPPSCSSMQPGESESGGASHRRRPAAATAAHCSALSHLPGAETGYGQQSWCRPLSGCAATDPPSAPDGSAAASAAAPPAAAELLPPIVALGKFDALHKGHRALAAAAAQLGGAPWLVSFSGIADVLGWPARLPLVAPCDRHRVLATWAPYCEGRAPRECAIPFAEVSLRKVGGG